MKSILRLGMLLSVLAIAGCTSFSGIKPLHPAVGNPNFPPLVKSLQPTLEWEASPNATSYDLIIYEGIKVSSFLAGTKRSVGREIYYKEGIKGTSFKVEEKLQPGRAYYWSVRARHGDTVSPWSVYDYTLFLGTGYVAFHNEPFLFETPEEGEK